MSYVVKVSAYLGTDGLPTTNIKNAKRYEREAIAEAAAFVYNGEVKKVITPDKIIPKKRKNIVHSEKCEQKRLTNQAWMRGGS